jgi:hypothetical protein
VSRSEPARQNAEAVDPAVFAADVRAALARTPRQLPSRYFYDELGSALFEAICRLPWYRITRAESALLARHARAMLQGLSRPVTLVELGCGSGDKLAIVAGAAGPPAPQVQIIDISAAALEMACHRLEAMGLRQVVAHHATYEDGLARAVRARPREGALAVLFLGSNLGNFDPAVGRALLGRVRRLLRAGDALLVIDLPAMNTRGPTKCPVSTAVLTPQSHPPVSRTVVKPRSIMARSRVPARAVSSVSGIASRKRTLTSLCITCTCASMRPGITVRPPQSTTMALSPLIGLSDSSLTLSPSTSSS